MIVSDLARILFVSVALAAALTGPMRAAEPEDAKRLFNGKDLSGWDGDPRFWRVESGEMVGETTEAVNPEKNTFLIYRAGEFADFDLRFKYQVQGFNSGVQYRSKDLGGWSVSGYQSDFEARHHARKDKSVDRFSGMFFEEKGRMFMGQRGQAVIVRTNAGNPKKPEIEVVGTVGDSAELESQINRDGWNEMRIVARGYAFTHIINGHVMSIAYDEDTSQRKPPASSHSNCTPDLR